MILVMILSKKVNPYGLIGLITQGLQGMWKFARITYDNVKHHECMHYYGHMTTTQQKIETKKQTLIP